MGPSVVTPSLCRAVQALSPEDTGWCHLGRVEDPLLPAPSESFRYSFQGPPREGQPQDSPRHTQAHTEVAQTPGNRQTWKHGHSGLRARKQPPKHPGQALAARGEPLKGLQQEAETTALHTQFRVKTTKTENKYKRSNKVLAL